MEIKLSYYINKEKTYKKKNKQSKIVFYFSMFYLVLTFLINFFFGFVFLFSLAVFFFYQKEIRDIEEEDLYSVHYLDDLTAEVQVFDSGYNSPSYEVRRFFKGVLHCEKEPAIIDDFFESKQPFNKRYYLKGQCIPVVNYSDFIKEVKKYKNSLNF